jgi:hypothetical protein
MMKELFKSFQGKIKERVENPLLGLYGLFWAGLNWQKIYVTFFVDQEYIAKKFNGALKSEYIQEYLVSNTLWELGWYWVCPLIFSLLWLTFVDKWVMTWVHKVHAENDVRKSIETEKIYERAERQKLETLKKTKKAVKKVAEERKEILDTDPDALLEQEFTVFAQHPLFKDFDWIKRAIYEHQGKYKDDWDSNFGGYVFSVPENIIAYSHANGLIVLKNKGYELSLTDKGIYFMKRFMEEM